MFTDQFGGSPPCDSSLGETLSTRLRRQLSVPPTGLDLAMVGAAALSYAYHLTGINVIGLGVLLVVWFVLWWLWARRRANIVTALFSLVVLALMLFGPTWHVGFTLERDCFEAKADAAIEVLPAAPLGNSIDLAHRVEDDGRCGLIDYRWVKAVHAPPADRDSGVFLPSVWFEGVGPTGWRLFGGKGVIFSPEGEPRCSNTTVGATHGCSLSSLGDGWYAYEYVSNIN